LAVIVAVLSLVLGFWIGSKAIKDRRNYIRIRDRKEEILRAYMNEGLI